jgi:hypothetical protein
MTDILVTIEEETVNVPIVEEALDAQILEETLEVNLAEEALDAPIVEEVINLLDTGETIQVSEGDTVAVEVAEVYERILEEAVPYAKQIDVTNNDTVIYKGEAVPGTLTSAAAWRISRITIASDNDTVVEWAAGNSNFAHVWDDHLTLSYS